MLTSIQSKTCQQHRCCNGWSARLDYGRLRVQASIGSSQKLWNWYFLEEFEDTKEVIRIRKSKKNRKHNGQKKKYKRTNNDLQTAKRAALTRKSHDTADKLLDWCKAIPHSHSLTHDFDKILFFDSCVFDPPLFNQRARLPQGLYRA
jgi:hypothetical protein